MHNAKNELHNLMKELGYYERCVCFETTKNKQDAPFTARAILTIRDGRVIEGIGKHIKKTKAEILACEHVLSIIRESHPDLIIDWEHIKIEAQAGDGLIKLCAYLSEETKSAEEKSLWLQRMETDKQMVNIFDLLRKENHPSFQLFGDNLGMKRKATWIEAIIWRQFGSTILAKDASNGFGKLVAFLSILDEE